MLDWKSLNKHEKEVMASQFAVSCFGEMELQSEEELKKIPESAWLEVERKREVKKQLEEKRLKDLADSEKVKLKAEVKEAKEIKKVKADVKKSKKVKLGAKKKRL